MSSKTIEATVELFAGIGGFRIASAQNGLQTLWANDICPKACEVYQSRFGDAEIHQGDIRELTYEIPPHDLLTAGFPCQPFSSAGQKKGFRDPRGMLFSVIVEILKEHRPPYFILENVKRLLLMEKGIHFATVLSALTELGYHIEWRLVNTRHFGLAQNRERVLILGSLDVKDNYPTIRLASLRDLCDSLGSNFRWLTDMSNWVEIEKHHRKFANWGLAFRQRFFSCNLECFSEAKPSVTLRSVLQSTVDPTFDFTESTLQRLEESTRINRFLDGVQLLYNQKRGARMGYTVFGIDGIAPTLTAATSRHYERYKVGDRYRRLTNVEYARLQGFPDDHCSAVSIYNQYALYGNAIPPIFANWVLDKILRNRLTALENVKEQQLYLFQEPMTYADKGGAEEDFRKKNAERARKDKDTIPDHEIESLLSIAESQPIILGIVDAVDNWIVENYKDFARLPNENEWKRLLVSPLNGQIGMSFALQWRYNFARVFRDN